MKRLLISVFISSLLLLTLSVNVYARRHETTVPTDVPPTGVDVGGGLNRACEVVEESLETRSAKIVMLAERILERFDNISQRVQEYYMTKLVPEGYTVENYDELLEEIESRKDDAESALDAAKAVADEFDCDLDDPKGTLMQFKEEMLAVIAALHEYRLAIKDLMVAVRTAVASGS